MTRPGDHVLMHALPGMSIVTCAATLTGSQTDLTVHQQAANAEYRRCMGIMWDKRHLHRHPSERLVVEPSIERVCSAVRSHVKRTGGAVNYEAIP